MARKTTKPRNINPPKQVVQLKCVDAKVGTQMFVEFPIKPISALITKTQTQPPNFEWTCDIVLLPHDAPHHKPQELPEVASGLGLVRNKKSPIVKDLNKYEVFDQWYQLSYKQSPFAVIEPQEWVGHILSELRVKKMVKSPLDVIATFLEQKLDTMTWKPLVLVEGGVRIASDPNWELLQRWRTWYTAKAPLKIQYETYMRAVKDKLSYPAFLRRLAYLGLPSTEKALAALREGPGKV